MIISTSSIFTARFLSATQYRISAVCLVMVLPHSISGFEMVFEEGSRVLSLERIFEEIVIVESCFRHVARRIRGSRSRSCIVRRADLLSCPNNVIFGRY